MKLNPKIKAVKEVKSYGNITLNSADFPGVKDLTLTETKEITISVEITALRKPDNWDISEGRMKPTDVIANVKILGVTLPEKMKKAKKEEK